MELPGTGSALRKPFNSELDVGTGGIVRYLSKILSANLSRSTKDSENAGETANPVDNPLLLGPTKSLIRPADRLSCRTGCC